MIFYSPPHWDVTERGGLLSLVCGALQQCILAYSSVIDRFIYGVYVMHVVYVGT